MSYKLDARDVEVGAIEIEIGEAAYAVHATWADSGIELTDDEMERLNDACADELYQSAYENAVCAAYDRARGDR